MSAAVNADPTPVGALLERSRHRWLAYLGPIGLVSVGYMDPGNWATDLEGGARFGYRLLWVLVVSNAMAILLQVLSAKLGIVSGLDLASACREHYSKTVSVSLWLLAEVAIIACDLAEILGSAVALNLLFGVPMIAGAIITVSDVLLIFWLQRRGARTLELVVAGFLFAIAACLAVEVVLARPAAASIVRGLVPRLDMASLYIAIGILGATVMPHNLYLHSAIVPRETARAGNPEKRSVLRKIVLSTVFALNLALLLNAAILIVAAAVFHNRGLVVSDLREAHALLDPLMGVGMASLLFALGLLFSGQSATITGTLAGQIVMEGFVRLRVSPVARRAITRGLAIIPAVCVLAVAGENGTMPLLVASQVVLSLQLPFAIVPLLRLTNSRELMGSFANSRWTRVFAVLSVAVVTTANAALVFRSVVDWHSQNALGATVAGAIAICGLGLLVFVSVVPLRRYGNEGSARDQPSPRLKKSHA